MDPENETLDDVHFQHLSMEQLGSVVMLESSSFSKRGFATSGLAGQWEIDDYFTRYAVQMEGEPPIAFGITASSKKGDGVGEDDLLGFVFLDIVSHNSIWIRKFIAEGPKRSLVLDELLQRALQHVSNRYSQSGVSVHVSAKHNSEISFFEKHDFKTTDEESKFYGDISAFVMTRLATSRASKGGGLSVVSPEMEEALNQRHAELSKIAKFQQQIWLPDVEGSGLLLSPSQCEQLCLNGINVVVEMSRQSKRPFSDQEYAIVGCSLNPSGSWQSAPNTAVILMPQDVLETMRSIAAASSLEKGPKGEEGEEEEEGCVNVPNLNKNFITSLSTLGFDF